MAAGMAGRGEPGARAGVLASAARRAAGAGPGHRPAPAAGALDRRGDDPVYRSRAGRAATEDLIGFFVNTLVIRADLSGDPTFADLLGRIEYATALFDKVTMERLA